MPTPTRKTAEAFYDVFQDMPIDDQAAALKILEQVHRLALREKKPASAPTAQRNGNTQVPLLGEYRALGGRVLGSVVCKGCNASVEVRYAYSNSNSTIGLADHSRKNGMRCSDAGRTLIQDGKWLKGAGYAPEEVAFDQEVAFDV